MTDAAGHPGFEWGTTVSRRAGSSIPFLMYEPRRRHLLELLGDVARWPGRDLIVQGERRISTEQFLGAVDLAAAHLTKRGVGPGDRVLLLAPNSPEWVVAFWAVVAAGAVVAPGNGWWSADEVAHAVDLLAPALVVGDDRRLAPVGDRPARLTITELQGIVDEAPRRHSGASPASPVGNRPPPTPPGQEDDPAVIIFTSGTTGLPKGGVLAHRSVIANLHNLLAVSKRLPHTLPPDSRGHVNLHTFPLFHIGGVQVMCFGLVTGGTLVFLEGRFETGKVLDAIERERVDVWGAVPTMALRVLDDPTLGRRDLTGIRSISLGGAPVPAELVQRLHAAFPNARRRVSTAYGMTEAGGTVAAGSGAVMAEHPGTSGRPLPVVELRIAEPDASGAGEILVRTPGQMLGYWDDAAGTPVDGDGFLHTGDLGRVDDGLLWVVGRTKDVVIRGGENIAAPRVEAVLLEHPAVAEVAVVGLPDPVWGEEVAAAIVARTGTAPAADVLAEFAAGRLAHFEVPARWWLRDEPLPVNDAGKVDKRALKAAWPSQDLTRSER
jgi:long-chain acyl-CoA synthetase